MVPLKKKGNTKVFERDGFTIVKLYSTEIVSFNENVIRLNSGGWMTVTTKQRMNQASGEFNLGFSVYQKNHKWTVSYNLLDMRSDTEIPFINGMSLARNLTSVA